MTFFLKTSEMIVPKNGQKYKSNIAKRLKLYIDSRVIPFSIMTNIASKADDCEKGKLQQNVRLIVKPLYLMVDLKESTVL